jgi:hypothetical protein
MDNMRGDFCCGCRNVVDVSGVNLARNEAAVFPIELHRMIRCSLLFLSTGKCIVIYKEN